LLFIAVVILYLNLNIKIMKRLMIILAAIGFSSVMSFSQYIMEFNPGRMANNSKVQKSKESPADKDAKGVNKNDPFIYPQFIGGNKKIQKYVSRHMIYPEVAMEKGIQGKVYVQFMVDQSGNVKNATVVKGADPILDAEALKIVSGLPSWEPGNVNGVPAIAYYIIPIEFKICNGMDLLAVN
jgi:TonB family protein